VQFVGRLDSARREKRTGRDYLGRWMQDANNDEGRRTNDVRLFVHSSHSVDRMSPSALNSFGIQNRGWVVTLRGSGKRTLVIIRRDNLLYGRVRQIRIVSIYYCLRHASVYISSEYESLKSRTDLRLVNFLILEHWNNIINIYQFLHFFHIIYQFFFRFI